MAPAPDPLGATKELKHFLEMSCWDCVGADCPLQFIHDKEGSFPKSEAGSFTSRSLPRPAMKTTFPYSGGAETSRRSMRMYGRHINM